MVILSNKKKKKKAWMIKQKVLTMKFSDLDDIAIF